MLYLMQLHHIFLESMHVLLCDIALFDISAPYKQVAAFCVASHRWLCWAVMQSHVYVVAVLPCKLC